MSKNFPLFLLTIDLQPSHLYQYQESDQKTLISLDPFQNIHRAKKYKIVALLQWLLSILSIY